MNTKTYCIIDATDVKYIHFNRVLESGPDSLRNSLDGTKTFVKYEGEQPECLFNIAGDLVGLPEYTHSEFIEILNSSEWTVQD